MSQLPKHLREKRDERDENRHYHRGYDACYADIAPMVEMLVKVITKATTWFDGLSKHQDQLLGKGFEEACNNWDKASNPEQWPEDMQSFDFSELRDALSAWRKMTEEK